jgi:hypothetical protein
MECRVSTSSFTGGGGPELRLCKKPFCLGWFVHSSRSNVLRLLLHRRTASSTPKACCAEVCFGIKGFERDLACSSAKRLARLRWCNGNWQDLDKSKRQNTHSLWCFWTCSTASAIGISLIFTTRRMRFGLVDKDQVKTLLVDYNTEPAEMCQNLTGTIIWVAGCTWSTGIWNDWKFLRPGS